MLALANVGRLFSAKTEILLGLWLSHPRESSLYLLAMMGLLLWMFGRVYCCLQHTRFQGPNPSHLYYDEEKRRIRLSSATEGSLFSALPSHLDVRYFSSRRDRVCIISKDRRLLLLDTSGLAAYMEICNLQFQPEVSRMKVCWFFVIEILINPIAANVSDDMAYGRRFSCLVVCIP